MDPVKEVLDARGKSRVQTVNKEPSMTIQSDAKDADIGHIIRQFTKTGVLQNLNEASATYMDVTEFTDYADVMRNLKVAEQTFMQLPSKTREIFGHDVAQWLDAAHDPEKRDALVAAGHLPAPEEPEVPIPARTIETAPLEPVVPVVAPGE